MQKKMNIQDVAKDIRNIISLNPGLIKKVGIFGSLARGDYNSESDIDLLIEYNMSSDFALRSFTNYCELCNKIDETLTDLYKRSVDIVHFENDSLTNLFDMNIENEVLWL